jgi:hypothetical protein
MPLAELKIRTAKTQEKPYKLTDGGGLYILIQSTGAKLWRFDYRFGGKRKTLAFGAYPHVSLGQARARLTEAKRLLAEGIAPDVQRKADKLAALEVARNMRAWADYLDKLKAEK